MAEKIVRFPDIPKDHYYEHYLSALIALSGRFVERSVVRRGISRKQSLKSKVERNGDSLIFLRLEVGWTILI